MIKNIFSDPEILKAIIALVGVIIGACCVWAGMALAYYFESKKLR